MPAMSGANKGAYQPGPLIYFPMLDVVGLLREEKSFFSVEKATWKCVEQVCAQNRLMSYKKNPICESCSIAIRLSQSCMPTKANNGFGGDMSTKYSRELFNFCQQAYGPTEARLAFHYPDWIAGLKDGSEAARVAHTCLQAAVLAVLQQSGTGPRLGGLDMHDLDPVGYLHSLMVIQRIREPDEFGGLAPALKTLADYIRFEGMPDWIIRSNRLIVEISPLHIFATEAAGRNAAAVTPADVTHCMLALIGAQRADAYAVDGLGLLYGADDLNQISVVGDELGSDDYQRPAALEQPVGEVSVHFKGPEFANRIFIDLEQVVALPAGSSDTLLVNAARQNLPFFPTTMSDEEDIEPGVGCFNHILSAGYRHVVAVVSNHFLTAGRGRAERILRHCLQHGLRKIVQLPMGVLGVRTQAHSILVFGNGPNNEEIELLNLMEAGITVEAPRGFGYARRARKLTTWHPSESAHQVVSVQHLLQNNGAKTRKLLSFEAGQLMREDPLEPLRNRYEFMRMGNFMEVFRSHHIAESLDSQRVQYVEAGAANISEEGLVTLGRVRECSYDSLMRRQAQALKEGDLILCFRGAPDTFGSAGIYHVQTEQTVMPNQSFVILRRRDDAPINAPTAAQVLWWIKSKYAQRYLQVKAIAHDVMRIAPRDIIALEVPCGPEWLIEKESETLKRVEKATREINELRTEVATLQAKAWN
jgi:hypothetical protein